jgi:cation transport ATPase
MGMRLLLLLALALPVWGQLRVVEIAFEGIGCASCIESLPARMSRFRGVESATVNAQKGVVTVKLAATNRVRIEQLRDAIEQDGTKVKYADIEATGTIAQDGGKWILRMESNPATYELAGSSLKEGPAIVTGKASPIKPTVRIEVKEIRPR